MSAALRPPLPRFTETEQETFSYLTALSVEDNGHNGAVAGISELVAVFPANCVPKILTTCIPANTSETLILSTNPSVAQFMFPFPNNASPRRTSSST